MCEIGDYLDEAGEAVGVDVHGHNAFVELVSDVFMVAVLGVNPENAFSLEGKRLVSSKGATLEVLQEERKRERKHGP